jgi:hypothetical protein
VSAIVAGIAAIAGAIQAHFVRKQSEHTSRLALATLHQQIAKQFIEFEAFFVDRPYLYPFFYEKAQVTQKTEYATQVRMTAEMIFDLAEFCHANEAVLGTLAHDWDDYFHNLYVQSPALQDYAKGYAYYPPRLCRLSALAEWHQSNRERHVPSNPSCPKLHPSRLVPQ